MKIGIVGLGSIGYRHARIISDLGHEVIALRREKTRLNSPLTINQFDDEDLFYKQAPDGVIISSPTALHKHHMKKPLSLRIPLLVEKPLMNTANEYQAYINYKNSIKAAYVLRFHAITKKLKKIVTSTKYGKLYKCNFYCGQYLPNWHPGEDYTQKYFSRKALGGGVLRTLSHEIDLAYYLLGEMDLKIGVQSKQSNLAIDVDDYAFIYGEFKTSKTLFSIELDYLNPTSNLRHGSFLFEKGIIHYSFSKGHIIEINKKNEEKTCFSRNPDVLHNHMYKAQLQSFLNFINGDQHISCASFEDAYYTMKIIEQVEKNTDEKKKLI